MEQITNYVKPELIVVAIALYFVGIALKQAQAVKDIAAGKMSFTMFMDRKELAKGGAQMAIDYLTAVESLISLFILLTIFFNSDKVFSIFLIST